MSHHAARPWVWIYNRADNSLPGYLEIASAGSVVESHYIIQGLSVDMIRWFGTTNKKKRRGKKWKPGPPYVITAIDRDTKTVTFGLKKENPNGSDNLQSNA